MSDLQNLLADSTSSPAAEGGSVGFGPLAHEYGMPKNEETRLLVIDDEPPTLRSLHRLLRRRAPELVVHMTSEPTQAHSCIEQFQPHVVLIDYTMPDIVGTDLCESILHRGYAWKPLVFGMSGQASYVVENSFRTAGAHAFFTKPLDVAALLLSLNGLSTTLPTMAP